MIQFWLIDTIHQYLSIPRSSIFTMFSLFWNNKRSNSQHFNCDTSVQLPVSSFLVLRKKYYQRGTAWKVSKYGVISGPYFPVFGLNTEIYEANLCIQSEYRKIRTRNNNGFGHFSRSGNWIFSRPRRNTWCETSPLR